MIPRILTSVVALSSLATISLAAQQALPALKEDKPGLAAQATIGPGSGCPVARSPRGRSRRRTAA